MAQRVCRGMVLLFHDRDTRRGSVVSSTPRPHFTPGKDPVSILQEARWGPRAYTDWATRPTKGRAVSLQAWSDPEGSRKLRFPDFTTMTQDGGKVVSFTHRPPLPPGNAPVRGWVDPRTIVRSKGFYVNENFQWHQLGSNQRPFRFVAQYLSHCATVVPTFNK